MFTTIIMAAALTYSPADFDKTDIALLTTLVVASTFDVMQTRAHLSDGSWDREMDPVLGAHPGAVRLWGTYAVAQIAAIGIAKVLPRPFRKIFEYTIVGLEVSNNVWNVSSTKKYYSWGETFKVSF